VCKEYGERDYRYSPFKCPIIGEAFFQGGGGGKIGLGPNFMREGASPGVDFGNYRRISERNGGGARNKKVNDPLRCLGGGKESSGRI